MTQTHMHRRRSCGRARRFDASEDIRPATRLWIVVGLAVLFIAGGVGLCRIQPSGRKAGLVQFDVVSEWSQDVMQSGNIVVFARYWVCEDYYAFSIVWTEPLGHGIRAMGRRLLSDETGWRVNHELFPDHAMSNATYPKPFGERPSFGWRGGWYGAMDLRYAESDALARRVYVSDLGPQTGLQSGTSGVIDVNEAKGPGGTARKLTRLKVQAKDDRIESMELFGREQQLLAKMHYEYERGAGPARLAVLTAELPPRPQKLAMNRNMTVTNPDGTETTKKVPDADYVYHKGGRTCTVIYEDVKLEETVLRLPVEVKVRRSDSNRVVRSARFLNYKRVELDKEGVWEAAKAFGGLDDEYWTWLRFRAKFLEHEARLGPPPVDVNDVNIFRRLLAKYPIWEEPKPPGVGIPESKVDLRRELGTAETDAEYQEAFEAHKRERAREQERLAKWRREVARMPRPPRKEVEPDDARLIRQLHIYSFKRSWKANDQLSEDERELRDLSIKLSKALRYHRFPPLPEDQPPEPNEADLERMRELKGYFENLALRRDKGVGGQLKALDALARLELMVKDYDALEGHAVRYLRMVDDARLNEMYAMGGLCHIERFVEAGEYERAKRLLGPWADRSAAVNDADGVYRFCDSFDGKADPWSSLQVLDRFLKKPGLSSLERYEGLALRAIILDRIDRLLADPDVAEDEALAAQARWILKNTTRAEIARRVRQAVSEAASAWQSLGPARMTEAKPYSTDAMGGRAQNKWEAPDATRLQETSAKLDQIVRRRMPQPRVAPRSPRVRQPARRR